MDILPLRDILFGFTWSINLYRWIKN